MLGNDIVDLHYAARESNWERNGFIRKVFKPYEQQILFRQKCLHSAIWLLWSMKEAGYKAHQRAFGHPPVLNWHRQECSLDQFSEGSASGMVTIEGENYFTRSVLTESYILTTAVRSTELKVHSGIFASSEEARKDLLDKVGTYFSFSPAESRIEKSSFNIPRILFPEKETFDTFSLTHHGRFGAHSFAVNDV